MEAATIVTPVAAAVIRAARDGDTILAVAKRTGFAYSAVHRAIRALAEAGVIRVEPAGRRSRIRLAGPLYRQYAAFIEAIAIEERDRSFWVVVRAAKGVRLARGSAAAVWTHGGYITGDFAERVYEVEAAPDAARRFAGALAKAGVASSKDGDPAARPFVRIRIVRRCPVERVSGVPVMPLPEFVRWCKRVALEPVLEQVDKMYGLSLGAKYSEASHAA